MAYGQQVKTLAAGPGLETALEATAVALGKMQRVL